MTHEQQLAEVWQPRLWEEVYVQSWLGVPGASYDGSQRLGSLLNCARLFPGDSPADSQGTPGSRGLPGSSHSPPSHIL